MTIPSLAMRKDGRHLPMRRGEIRWYTFAAPDKRRPVLILARDTATEVLDEIIVAPLTRTIRGLATEVVLTPEHGVPVVCAINFDHVALAQRQRIGALVATLGPARWPEVRRALLVACGFEPTGRGAR
jgi:mRNA interferase MazF